MPPCRTLGLVYSATQPLSHLATQALEHLGTRELSAPTSHPPRPLGERIEVRGFQQLTCRTMNPEPLSKNSLAQYIRPYNYVNYIFMLYRIHARSLASDHPIVVVGRKPSPTGPASDVLGAEPSHGDHPQPRRLLVPCATGRQEGWQLFGEVPEQGSRCLVPQGKAIVGWFWQCDLVSGERHQRAKLAW